MINSISDLNNIPHQNQSFNTPNKNKNVSSIETNASTNLVSFPSQQYSAIQLSQSINASPSFLSPSKQIGSFLITPNAQHHSPSSQLGLSSNIRVKTQSQNNQNKKSLYHDQFQTGKIGFQNTQNTQISHERQKKKVLKSQIRSFIQILNQYRFNKQQSQQNERNLRSIKLQNHILQKTVQSKEQQVQNRKIHIQRLIQTKKILLKKVQEKKKLKEIKEQQILKELQNKIDNLKEQVRVRQNQLNYELRKIQQLQYESEKILHQIKKRMNQRTRNHNFYDQIANNHHRYPPGFSPHYSPYQNQYFSPRELENVLLSKQHSSTKKLSVPISPVQTPRQVQKIQNPEFNLIHRNQYAHDTDYSFQNKREQLKNSINCISPINRSNQSGNSIINMLNQGFLQKFAQSSNKIAQNHQKSSQNNPNSAFFNNDYNQDRQIIQFLQENQNRINLDKNNSNIHINLSGEFEDLPVDRKSSARSRNSHSRQDPRHAFGPNFRLPDIAQSQVNINYQSQLSDNFYKAHQFNNFSENNYYYQQNQPNGRMRSPTQVLAPYTRQEQAQLRRTQNYKNSDISVGQQTPIFRSQASDQQVRLSQPIFGSLKNSQSVEQIRSSENDFRLQKKNNEQSNNKQDSDSSKQVYSVYSVYSSSTGKQKAKQQQPIYSVKNQNADKPNINSNADDDDDDFSSITLGTESKISFRNSPPKKRQDDFQISELSKKPAIRNTETKQIRYDSDFGSNDFPEDLRYSTRSKIIKSQKKQIKKVQQGSDPATSFKKQRQQQQKVNVNSPQKSRLSQRIDTVNQQEQQQSQKHSLNQSKKKQMKLDEAKYTI